jgi:excisionase family DNA binding protein
MADVANLTIGDAARILGVSVDTVRRWSDEGRVPVVVLPSGHRRYRRSDIDAFIAGGAA